MADICAMASLVVIVVGVVVTVCCSSSGSSGGSRVNVNVDVVAASGNGVQ